MAEDPRDRRRNPLNIMPETWAAAVKETQKQEQLADARLVARIAEGQASRIQATTPIDYMLAAYAAHREEPVVDLLGSYRQGAGFLEAAADGFSADQARARPIPGKWSALELVGHVADVEQFFADRMKRTIALDRPLLMGVDENKYMAALNYQDRDLGEELALIRLTRSQMLRILKPLPDSAWSRPAIHSEAGLMTLHQLVFNATFHLKHHLPFLFEKRKALGL